MPFWRGETLAARLPDLISPYDEDCIECAAYALHVGQEVFITSDQTKGDPKEGLKIQLAEKAPVNIPAGQFAFLLTEESVTVPSDAIAFISMKTTEKFRGLVNVSGFHVDPGWTGHLKFGIYNAGPQPVHFCQGNAMFLIWYASLDEPTGHLYQNDPEKCGNFISNKLINGMVGQILSPMILATEVRNTNSKIDALEHKLRGEMAKVEGQIISKIWLRILLLFLVTVILPVLTLLGKAAFDYFERGPARIEQRLSTEEPPSDDSEKISPRRAGHPNVEPNEVEAEPSL